MENAILARERAAGAAAVPCRSCGRGALEAMPAGAGGDGRRPLLPFLFCRWQSCPEATYYRWRVFACSQGDCRPARVPSEAERERESDRQRERRRESGRNGGRDGGAAGSQRPRPRSHRAAVEAREQRDELRKHGFPVTSGAWRLKPFRMTAVPMQTSAGAGQFGWPPSPPPPQAMPAVWVPPQPADFGGFDDARCAEFEDLGFEEAGGYAAWDADVEAAARASAFSRPSVGVGVGVTGDGDGHGSNSFATGAGRERLADDARRRRERMLSAKDRAAWRELLQREEGQGSGAVPAGLSRSRASVRDAMSFALERAKQAAEIVFELASEVRRHARGLPPPLPGGVLAPMPMPEDEGDEQEGGGRGGRDEEEREQKLPLHPSHLVALVYVASDVLRNMAGAGNDGGLFRAEFEAALPVSLISWSGAELT